MNSNFSFKLVIILLSLFSISSCKKDEEQRIYNGHLEILISLPVHKEITSAIVSIVKKDGTVIYDQEEIKVKEMNKLYISNPIKLGVGDYFLTEFLLIDDSNTIIYASPKENSIRSDLVNNPLSMAFRIEKDEVFKLAPVVISVEESTPADFGYTSLDYKFISMTKFFINTFTHNNSILNFELSPSNLEIKNQDKILFSGELGAITNKIKIRNDVSEYELTVTKDGYKAYRFNFTPDSLEYYDIKKNNGPLEIVLMEDIDISTPPIEFIRVEGGTFTMGNNAGQWDEQPEHLVTVDDFQISKYEIVQSQFIEFLNDIHCNKDGRFNDPEYGNIKYIVDIKASYCPITYIGGQFYFKGSESAPTTNCPAIGVTWYGANAFCKWAGGRLPYEAEWEFAARGGNNSKNYIYAGSNNYSEVAWYYYNSGLISHPVGLKQANELGIYDMNGNVWEWCADWYSEYSSEDQINPQGPSTGIYRVNRGAGHRSNQNSCRITNRHDNAPGYYETHGIRIAKTID